ncbi:hypothetical protein EON65_18675 [archaeon]|nr:MAG: hypothetical protein EON65_18675 [archaeon]
MQGFNGDHVRKFIAMRKLLEDFSHSYGYGNIQNAEVPDILLAKVFILFIFLVEAHEFTMFLY